MVLKIGAIIALVFCGLLLAPWFPTSDTPAGTAPSTGLLMALTPVMFAYGGWQTASFVAAEMRDPRRDLARGLLMGVIGVVILYTAVTFTCVAVLGPAGLAETRAPASAVMRLALGETGANLIALGVTISALGFLSQGMLTTPRVYFAMAEDRMFFPALASVSPRTHAPVLAILLQGVVACLIALTGTYGQILSYVVSVDFIWFALTGAALLVFRARDHERASFQVPGHPVTTWFFILACVITVIGTVAAHPANSAIGFAILAAGVPACLWFMSRRSPA
jgi:APA family basic amino acid/polyamine antiporter